ncbi:MAG: hypothetical protein K5888_02580 [Lachnospiraceae bacterium]|nr:hypothetical protein [Lachnospiraceae bacterium]
MGQDLTWLSQAGLDINTGMELTGGEDRYLSAVRRFYSNYEKNRDKVTEFYNAGDYENYMITVHALKSNAKMIGALDLGSAFEELELASRNGDIATVKDRNDKTMFSYKELIDALKPIEELGDVRAADEISADVAKTIADELLNALDDFDDDLSKQLVNKLMGYPFRITQKDMLKQAAGYVDDFMYDEAADLIKKIYPSIE